MSDGVIRTEEEFREWLAHLGRENQFQKEACDRIVQAERRAIRDEIREMREQFIEEDKRGYHFEPILFFDDMIDLFEPGGRFEVEDDVANPPQSRTSVEDSTQREAALDQLANEGRDHGIREDEDE